MSGCNNCYNGCLETTSDQCIKYTGLPITFLGIATNDSLSIIEDKIFTYLLTVLDGTGIVPDIISKAVCTSLDGFLPVEGEITLNDLLSALVQTICSLQTQIDALSVDMVALNADYVIENCLTGVITTSDTHGVLQAVIDRLCLLVTEVENIVIDLTNYELKSDLNSDIAAYLSGIASSKMYNKMVPYVAVEYYGALSNYPTVGDSFDVTGAGQGAWEKVYLCNGQNGTPDKRGFSPVGATTMGATALNSKVTGLAYTSNSTYGEKAVTITTATMPAHTHIATAVITPNPHTHTFDLKENGTGNVGQYPADSDNISIPQGTSVTNSTSLSVAVSNTPIGSGEAHNNIPPVLAVNYIIYLP